MAEAKIPSRPAPQAPMTPRPMPTLSVKAGKLIEEREIPKEDAQAQLDMLKKQLTNMDSQKVLIQNRIVDLEKLIGQL